MLSGVQKRIQFGVVYSQGTLHEAALLVFLDPAYRVQLGGFAKNRCIGSVMLEKTGLATAVRK